MAPVISSGLALLTTSVLTTPGSNGTIVMGSAITGARPSAERSSWCDATMASWGIVTPAPMMT